MRGDSSLEEVFDELVMVGYNVLSVLALIIFLVVVAAELLFCGSSFLCAAVNSNVAQHDIAKELKQEELC